MFTLLWYNVKKMSKFIIFFSMQKNAKFQGKFWRYFLKPQKLPWNGPLKINYVVLKKITIFVSLKINY